ncbi:hypothetical protein Ptr902_13097 [Pyrenophora tritici-repentis]|nr:hypothetical protein L13192_10712 [Pyrenophora tritici-repentis]KAI2475517.1 hypothetical protein Ptr902_13097 [Pyrenophora tritici-repentis]
MLFILQFMCLWATFFSVGVFSVPLDAQNDQPIGQVLAPRAGVHDCIWAFAVRPPRVNSGSRLEITSFIARDQRMADLVIQANVPIRATVQATPSQAGANQHNVVISWTNNLFDGYTVLFERFLRTAPPDPSINRQPDNIDEAILPAAQPNPFGASPGSVVQTHCVDTNRYRYFLQIGGPRGNGPPPSKG